LLLAETPAAAVGARTPFGEGIRSP